MKCDEKSKSYFFSKALIIILSLIILLNGLGLIVAGKKVNKKSWVVAGTAYIVIEWICAITGVGITAATILYFVSIIHTALICSEYGRLRAQKDGEIQPVVQRNIPKEEFESTKQEVPAEKTVVENSAAEADKSIRIDSIQLDIGTAAVTGAARDKLKIKVQDETGKVYEFNTVGNTVESFTINGKMYSYGG